MPKLLQLELDRTAKTPLAEQIRNGISNAIENGVLASGARLPSWQDLAAQLGVARGTVRSAYEKLSAGQLIVASRATGTHVAARPSIAVRLDQPPDRGSFMEMYQELTARPGIFQMGVPAQETFPATLLRPDSLTRGSRGIECGAVISGPSRRAGSAAGNSRLSRHRGRHRMFALPDRRHRRLRQRPRIGAPCARARGAESLDGGSWFSVHEARARARKIVARADPGRW